MIDLSGKTALVTGAGRGIGRAMALILAEQGADVAVPDINEESSLAVSKEIKAMGRNSINLGIDVTSRPSVEETFSSVISQWGHLDILINNAGVYAAPGYEDSPEDREEDWDSTFAINVKGTVFCCKAVMPHVKERRYGKIINIASIAGRWSNPWHLHYCASKASVISYTQGLARMLAPFNINVNAICPGILWTDMWKTIARRLKVQDPSLSDVDISKIKDDTIAQRIPLGREQTPQDIGKTAAFLASDDAKNITGQAIQVDGGSVMI